MTRPSLVDVDSASTDIHFSPGIMRTLVVVFLAGLCFAQFMEARVVRDTAAQTTWEDLMNLGVESWNNMTRTIQTHLDKDQLKTQLETSASELSTKIQQAVEQLKAQAPQLGANASALVQQAAHTLEDHAKELRKQFPDAAQGVDSMKTKMDSVMNEVRQIQQSLQPHLDSASDNIKQATRTLLEQSTAIAQNMQQEVQRLSGTTN